MRSLSCRDYRKDAITHPAQVQAQSSGTFPELRREQTEGPEALTYQLEGKALTNR